MAFDVNDWAVASDETKSTFTLGPTVEGSLFPTGDTHSRVSLNAPDFIGMDSPNYYTEHINAGDVYNAGWSLSNVASGDYDVAGHFYLPNGENYETGFEVRVFAEIALYHTNAGGTTPGLAGCATRMFDIDDNLIEMVTTGLGDYQVLLTGTYYDGDDVYCPDLTDYRYRRYQVFVSGRSFSEPVDKISFQWSFVGADVDQPNLRVGYCRYASYRKTPTVFKSKLGEQRAIAPFL